MTSKMVIRSVGALMVVLASMGTARGQEIEAAQNKLLAKRAAEADAYRKLAETIKGVQINSETYVRDFVAESDEIRADVDTLVRGARLGQPTYYEDGVCEIPAEVTVAKVIRELTAIHTRHYKGHRVRGTDFEQIKEYIKKDIIQVVGMGAPRPDLPPNLPEGVEEIITQVNLAPAKFVRIPPIWKSIPPQERLKAGRAATLDAQRKLLERIKGLRLNSETLVKDFITEYDEIQVKASGIVIGAREVAKYHHEDELIVEVTMAVSVESVITTIKELHTRHYRGKRVTGTDIINLKRSIKKDTFEATGAGVPGAQYIRQASASTGSPVADWATERITAIGQGVDPEIQTPQGRLKAARAAELDAKRKLLEYVHGLRIDSTTLVRDFVTQYDEIGAQLTSVLVGSVVESTTWEGDVATVTVSLAGMEVWSVIHQQLSVLKRR